MMLTAEYQTEGDAKFEAAFGKFALGDPINDEKPKMRRFDLGFLWFAANRMIGKGLERDRPDAAMRPAVPAS